ncbi:MAG: (2Fe-2S)-binding protein [Elusimicrobia bacterium]|nr:(2Fe-2S)-binding protein [Elusimicrobiota bacterium]
MAKARGAAGKAGGRRASGQPERIKIRVNGVWHEFAACAEGAGVEASETLSHLLRERLGLTGLKLSCDEGACGACTVILDGKAVLSCMTLAVEADGRSVLTIEGLPKDDPVIRAFAQQCEPGYGTALQCGYCTPGFVMASRALLDENPAPTPDEIKDGLSGNICRCGCYAGIARAVWHASRQDASSPKADGVLRSPEGASRKTGGAR